MKTISFIIFVVILLNAGFSQERIGTSFRTQSYYGFSGLTFIPNAQIAPPGQFGISYSSRPSGGDDLNLLPYSVRFIYGTKIAPMEVASTNTPVYASERMYGGVSVSQGISGIDLYLPVFPTVKYLLMPMKNENYNVSMAVGFALPYGVYYVVDKFVDVTFFDLTIHTGVATKLTTYHVFGGLTTTFGNRIGEIQRGFNLEMLLEASWAGSLKQLDKKEESFISLSFRYGWTRTLFITTFIRYDNQPLTEDGEVQNSAPTTRIGVGLDYHW